MQNFMILIREEISRLNEMSDAEMQAEIQEYTQWVEELSKTGNYISGDPLEAEGRYMTKSTVVSDGPFIESKEAITGYLLIQADDLDQAVQLSKSCPIFKYEGALEIRPIMKY